MPADVSSVVLQVSAAGVTYATIADLSQYNADHGQESETKIRVFGQANAYVRTGDLTDTYSFSGLYNIGDTNGQNVLRTSRDTRAEIFIQIWPEGNTISSGKKGYKQAVKVTSYTDEGDADGDYVRCSFEMVSTGSRTEVTAPTT